MSLYQKFLHLSRGKQIALIVCSVHFLAVFGLLFHHLASRQIKPPRPIKIAEYKSQPAKPVEKAVRREVVSENIKASPSPKKTAPPVSKQQLAKPVATAAKKTVAAKKPAVKPSAPTTQKEQQIFKEIVESLESLNTESKKERLALTLPSPLQPKTEMPFPLNSALTEEETLIAFLQSALDLPEYGDVKVKMEIDRFGNLIDCQILETKSAKNAEFLKNQLPQLVFPTVTSATRDFTIVFRNAE